MKNTAQIIAFVFTITSIRAFLANKDHCFRFYDSNNSSLATTDSLFMKHFKSHQCETSILVTIPNDGGGCFLVDNNHNLHVIYTCQHGKLLVGDGLRICDENGKWSGGRQAKCILKKNDPSNIQSTTVKQTTLTASLKRTTPPTPIFIAIRDATTYDVTPTVTKYWFLMEKETEDQSTNVVMVILMIGLVMSLFAIGVLCIIQVKSRRKERITRVHVKKRYCNRVKEEENLIRNSPRITEDTGTLYEIPNDPRSELCVYYNTGIDGVQHIYETVLENPSTSADLSTSPLNTCR